MLFRAIQHSDHDGLLQLARHAGVGVTTLQPDADRLERRIDASVTSMADGAARGDLSYLFVLERDGDVVGTSAVEAAVGLAETWYNYRVGLSVHSSRELGIYEPQQTLFLTSDLTGASELCSLFLKPEARQSGNGALLSKARFLFMAEHPERFAERVIAEMRGVSDDDGRSPFWESLGRHFFKMDFARADYLSYVGNRSFIAELMPQYPIYTCLLSDEAQAAIADVHPATRPARRMLENEGFRYRGYVDIFDAGPSLECALGDIRAVRDAACFDVLPVTSEPKGAEPWLVSNRGLADFRAMLVHTRPLESTLPLPPQAIEALGLAAGASVRAVPLHPQS
ncbi:arginine N-succinyltransferase [Chitinibacteraceae bacterium HSL-7]